MLFKFPHLYFFLTLTFQNNYREIRRQSSLYQRPCWPSEVKVDPLPLHPTPTLSLSQWPPHHQSSPFCITLSQQPTWVETSYSIRDHSSHQTVQVGCLQAKLPHSISAPPSYPLIRIPSVSLSSSPQLGLRPPAQP